MTKTSLTRFIPQRILRYGPTDLCPLDGDIPALQLLNTCRNRDTANTKNYINTYEDFLTWCYEIRLIDQDTHNLLEIEGNCYVQEAAGIVNQIILTREMLYDLICSIRYDEPVHHRVVEEFNAINDEANKHLRFAMTGYGLRKVWRNVDEEMAFPLWLIIKHTGDFLMSEDVKFIKKCHCGSFYLDKTKNHNRRYCNPLTCGSARRSTKYYQRCFSVTG